MRLKRIDNWPVIWIETMLDFMDDGLSYAQVAEKMGDRFKCPFTQAMIGDQHYRLKQGGYLE